MKNKSKYIFILSVLSTILGLLISTQISQKLERYNMVSLGSIEIMKNEIANSENEIEDLNNMIAERATKLTELREAINRDDSTLEEYLSGEIETLKLIGGTKDIRGKGIQISIGDNESKEIIGNSIQDDIIHDSELQIILNDLKNADAEAISINGERVIYRSEVKCGGPIIRINGRSSANPFIINVIGDPKLLYASVTAKESFGWTLKKVYNKKVDVEIKDNIVIPKYNWIESNFRYANPMKEGD